MNETFLPSSFNLGKFKMFKYRFKKKGKSVLVTGREGQSGCETSRLPHCLDNQLMDGGEVVSLRRRLPFTPRKIPGTHFCWRLSRPRGYSVVGRIRSIEKSNDLIGN
jgi:hypothetical protein